MVNSAIENMKGDPMDILTSMNLTEEQKSAAMELFDTLMFDGYRAALTQ